MTRTASLCAVSLLLSLHIACGEKFETPTGTAGGTGGSAGVGATSSGGTGGTQSGGSAGVGGSAGATAGGTGGDSGSTAGTGGAAAGTGGTGGASIVDCTGVQDGTQCAGDGGNTLCVGGSCVESRCGDSYVDTDGGEGCDDGQDGDDADGCTDECKVRDPRLGAACKVNGDCSGTVGNLTCMPASEGFGNGVCSRSCLSDDDCAGHVCKGGGTVEGFCQEACTFGEPQEAVNGGLDPNKCHGRPDAGCYPATDTQGELDFSRSSCVSVCRNDTDCAVGAYCSAKTGFCQGTPSTGLPYGADCTCATDCSADDPCAGFCLGGISGGAGTCTQLCVNGDRSLGACGSATTGHQAGMCFTRLGFADGPEAGIGDALGSCGELCDCNGACRGQLDCFDLSSFPGGANPSGQPGVCLHPYTIGAVLPNCP